jgi:hypothetical protein
MFWQKAPEKEPLDLERAKKAIVRVGANGRGFMTGGAVVTTAHWLPNYPQFKYPRYRTVEEWEEAVTDELLLGRLDEKLTVEASCEFADPFSNIAIVSGFSEGYRRQCETCNPYSTSGAPGLNVSRKLQGTSQFTQMQKQTNGAWVS